MIKLQGKLQRKKLMVSVSGGVDSMAALDFLRRSHDVEVFHYNHGTEYGEHAEDLVRDYVRQYKIPFQFRGMDKKECPPGRSKEDWWRENRYKWLNMFAETYTGYQIITCHHLDDCIETWVWSSMHGKGKIIPYNNGQGVIRPFRLTTKEQLRLWADLNSVPYLEDDSNKNLCYTRNYIRHEMMPHVKRVNPGISKLIKKKVMYDGTTNSY